MRSQLPRVAVVYGFCFLALAQLLILLTATLTVLYLYPLPRRIAISLSALGIRNYGDFCSTQRIFFLRFSWGLCVA